MNSLEISFNWTPFEYKDIKIIYLLKLSYTASVLVDQNNKYISYVFPYTIIIVYYDKQMQCSTLLYHKMQIPYQLI